MKVTFRKMKFDFEEGFDRHWHSGSPFLSHFWSALSQAFTPGEKFFIDSVRAVQDRIDDPELLEEIDQFIRQEAHHTAQHRKLNRMIQAMGYDTDKMEARYARALDRCRRILGPKGMLSITMALEHFTAGFAHQYFTNPDVADGADPKVAALWAWHAAEEAEHKSTAFDVYDRIGGGYFTRAAMLTPSWCTIVVITLHNVLEMMHQDGRLWDMHDQAKGLRYLFGRRGLLTRMVPAFFSYLKPSFEPWEEDDSAELAEWERQNQAYIQQRGVSRPANTTRVQSAAAAAPV